MGQILFKATGQPLHTLLWPCDGMFGWGMDIKYLAEGLFGLSLSRCGDWDIVHVLVLIVHSM